MNSPTSIKSVPHRSIEKVIDIGHGGAITTRIRGILTGPDGSRKEVFNREGHSYTRGFIELLHSQAASLYSTIDAKNADDIALERLPVLNASSNYGFGFVITAATAASPCRITIAGISGNDIDSYPVRFSELTHTGGTLSATNGVTLYPKYISAGVFDLYEDTALTVPHDRSAEGAYDASSGRIWLMAYSIAAVSTAFKNDLSFADSETWELPSLYLGNSTQAVNIQDTDLQLWNGALWDGRQSQIRDIPVVSATRSYIQFTRDFQNTSGAATTVEEIGLFANNAGGDDDPAIMIARDLQTIAVPDASTLTLEFEIETTIDIVTGNNEGGITQWFNELLYRFIAQTTRTVTDRLNANHTEGPSVTGFAMTSGPFVKGGKGGSRLRPYTGSNNYGDFGHYVGPVVGRDDSTSLAVAQDNYTLGDLIEPGDGIGELWYGGSYVHDLVTRGGGWGSLTLTGGGGGSVDTLTVNGVSVISGAVSFNTSLSQTALDIAANINAHTSSPNYTASAVGRVVTIKAAENVGTAADGFAVAATYTTLTGSTVALADGNTSEFKVSRLFENKSGEDIVIKEVGLFVNIDGDYFQQGLIARHIHDGGGAPARPSSTTVSDGEVLLVTYTIRASV
jgi:hypothetical protein